MAADGAPEEAHATPNKAAAGQAAASRAGPNGHPGDARMLSRVRWQLVGWSGGVVLLVLLALGAALYLAVDRTLEANGVDQLNARARPIAHLISTAQADQFSRFIGIAIGGPSSGTFALVMMPNGDLIYPRGIDLLPGTLPDGAGITAAKSSSQTDLRTIQVGGAPFRILSMPVNGPPVSTDGLPVTASGTQYVIQVVQDITAERRTLDTLLVVLALGGLVAVLVAVAAGAVNARRALVPIRDALRRQREFAADASHELRTPLTVVRASVDDLRRNADRPVGEVGAALDDITAEVDNLTALVADLLLLARSDSGAVELAREPLDLGEVATDAASGLAVVAAQEDVRLAVDPEPTELTGDPARLRQLVTILIDNAIRHGPKGGTVTITARREPREACLTVDDEGPGIAPADREHVFDRFWRAPGARPGGTGLGLAIAAWIVEQHRGTIAVTDRPGGGARFVVRLPIG